MWLIKIGEPLPIKGNDIRLLRTGIFFEHLSLNGDQVTWWSSTFSHTNKKHLFNTDKKINLFDHSRLYLIHSVGYKKNISLRRILDHTEVAHKFKYLAKTESVPDIIFCSMPTLELGLVAVNFGKEHNVPVIIDLRDMWPDIFINRAPKRYQSILKIMLAYSFYQIRTICKNATAITGITPGYVEWGLQYAERNKSHLDRYFPIGYSNVSPEKEKIKLAEIFWSTYGIHSNNNEFIVCLFSNIVRQLELETVIETAKRLETTGRSFRFVFCGKGDALAYFKNIAQGCSSVFFPGWVNKSQIWTLMRFAQIGLAPYRSTPDFIISIPNKVIEYMSAGLPIVSSLKGTTQELLSRHSVGLTYENENVESLFSLLCSLYDDREILKNMSTNSQTLFNEQFVAEKIYSNMRNYLEEVIENYNIPSQNRTINSKTG